MASFVGVCRIAVLVCLVALLSACAQNQRVTTAMPQQGFAEACPAGTVMRAKDSNGAFKFLRSPVEQDSLQALQILQKYGPIPRDFGEAMLKGVDQGQIQPYHGPGFVLWYFHQNTGLPSHLPWVDSGGNCKGSTPVVASDEFKGWVYAKVPHGARLNVPTALLLKGPVCARAKDFPTVHDVHLTEGSFVGQKGVICSVHGRMQEIFALGKDGVWFVFVTSSDRPATPNGGKRT